MLPFVNKYGYCKREGLEERNRTSTESKYYRDISVTSKKVLVLTSGGIDSTACLIYYKEMGYYVEAIFVDYGHPANPVERDHISNLCSKLNVPLNILELRGANINDADEIRGRNAFLILAALVAKPDFAGMLSLGIHSNSPYYDCGLRFINLMQNLVSDYTQGAVQLDLPFMEMDKVTVVDYCRVHDVPLDLTYSCQVGGEPPCGNCPSCKGRNALGLNK